MILELKDICKTYLQGKLEVPVLKNVSLSVDEGEYVAIMGPSGSGKTTLMNIIGCLDSPTSGDYLLEGQNVAGIGDSKMSDVRLHSIGFVFQSFYLLSRQSALDNVALPLLYAGVGRRERGEIARKALERVGLGDRTEFKPTQLSGGQCQRVAIARAIVNNPKILLADEPTGALDTRSGEQIMEIFQSLNQEGVTILMITHEPEIAAHAKRVLYIRDGLLTDAPQAAPPAPESSGAGRAAEEAPPAPRPQAEKGPALVTAREERRGKGAPRHLAAPASRAKAAPGSREPLSPRQDLPSPPEEVLPAAQPPATPSLSGKEESRRGRFGAPIPVALDGLGFGPLRKGGVEG